MFLNLYIKILIAGIRRSGNSSCSKDLKQWELSSITGAGGVKRRDHFENCLATWCKVKHIRTSDSATPILCFHSKEIKTYVHKKKPSGGNTRSSFIHNSSNLKDVRCLPTGNELTGCMYTMKYYSAIKRKIYSTWRNSTDFRIELKKLDNKKRSCCIVLSIRKVKTGKSYP